MKVIHNRTQIHLGLAVLLSTLCTAGCGALDPEMLSAISQALQQQSIRSDPIQDALNQQLNALGQIGALRR